MGNEVTLTQSNFKAEVLESEVPVLVDFWADWCMPCKMLAPILEQVAEENDGKIKIGKVNADEQGELAAEHNIVSLPTLLLFKDGEVVNQQIGAVPKATIEGMFKEYL